MNKATLFKTHETLLQLILLVFGTSLFLLPVLHAWLLFPLGLESHQTTYSALAGLIPYSDAQGYYEGANHFLETGQLDFWNTRRPLNAILLSIRLWLFNDGFKGALILQALLCGLSAMLVTLSITRVFGWLSGVLTFTILFLFASVFSPTTLSETLGLTLGCLAFVMLWSAIETEKKFLFFMAGLMLMIGLNARAGAFLVLPCLILWFGLYFRKETRPFNWQIVSFFAVGLICGMGFNLVLIKLYANPTLTGGAMHGNFAPTLFGLVSGGKSWTYANIAFPELASKQTEAEVAQYLYAKSLEQFINNPFLLLKGIFHSLAGLIKALISFFFQTNSFQSVYIIYLIRIMGLACLIFGAWRLKTLYPRYRKEIGFICIGLLGCFLSAGIIWTDGGFRVFAVTIPFVALAFGLIFGCYRFMPTDTPKITWETSLALMISISLIGAPLIAPRFMKGDTMGNLSFDCADSSEQALIVKNVHYSPNVNISKQTGRYKRSIDNSLIESKQPFLELLNPSLLSLTPSLGIVTERDTGNSKMVIAPQALFENREPIIGICIKELPKAKGNYWQVVSFKPLQES